MSARKRGVSTKQINAIRKYSRQGLSANKIQKRLRTRHMGMRRTVLLTYVREMKHQQPKANVSMYVPRKYYRVRFGGKQVAEYGTVRGKPRRIQVYGDGKQLYKVIRLISRHPPRERFLTIDANRLLSDPERFLSEGYWDARPRIKS